MRSVASGTPRVARSYAVALTVLLLVLVAPYEVTGPQSTVTVLVAAALAAALLRLAAGMWLSTPVGQVAPLSSFDDERPALTARLVTPPLFPVRPRAPGLG